MSIDNYELSEDTLNELGINQDYSERTPDDEKTPPDKEGKDDKLDGDSEKNKSNPEEKAKSKKETAEGEKGDDKNKPDDEKTPPEEKGKDDKLDGEKQKNGLKPDDVQLDKATDKKEGDEPSFNTKVTEYISKFDDSTKEKFLTDLESWDKFTASSTQRSQNAADKEKKAQQLFDLIGGDGVREALQNNEFMEAMDEWFDLDFKEDGDPDKSKNPFRTIELNNIDNFSKEKQLIENSNKELALEKEILVVQRLDKKYEDDKELQKLGEYADEVGTNLIVAARLKEVEQKNDELKTLKETNKNIQKQLDDTKQELTKRNKDYQKLEKTSAPIFKPGADGAMGAEKVDFQFNNRSTFDEIEAGLKRK